MSQAGPGVRHVVLVFPPFRRKTLRLSTPELVLRPVHSAARKSIDSELTPARAAGDYKNDKESEFPVKM